MVKKKSKRQHVTVIMPAYNAARTLEWTYNELPHDIVDEVILVDDVSADDTIKVAKRLKIKAFLHKQNKGYGGNQKTCYREALKTKADIIVMVHPDYQYDSSKLPQLIKPLIDGKADVGFGSRMLGGGALKGGMPFYKYLSNKFLTGMENLVFGLKLSEYHTGYRAFRREVLENIPFQLISDDFIFDQDIVAQIVYFKYRIAEIGVETRYFEEASSINFWRSAKYGLSIFLTLGRYLLQKSKLVRYSMFKRMKHDYEQVT
jgi:glycosyltransferase involved in cell wall biosynthesis